MPFGKPKKPFTPLDENALREYAVQSLGRRARSEADLRRLMRAKVEPDENGAAKIDKVIARLKEYGYLNDTVFAENYTQLRQQNEKFGARRVQQELNRKGIAKQTITDTIEAKYSEINEETLAREHLDRQAHSQAGERKGDGAGDAAAGDCWVLSRRDLQNPAAVGCAG